MAVNRHMFIFFVFRIPRIRKFASKVYLEEIYIYICNGVGDGKEIELVK